MHTHRCHAGAYVAQTQVVLVSVADLEKFVGGGPNICWVAGRLVIGDNFGSQ